MTTNVEGRKATVAIPINDGIRGAITTAENSEEKQRRSRPTPSITLGHMMRPPSTNLKKILSTTYNSTTATMFPRPFTT
jgi:hypothetical protein